MSSHIGKRGSFSKQKKKKRKKKREPSKESKKGGLNLLSTTTSQNAHSCMRWKAQGKSDTDVTHPKEN